MYAGEGWKYHSTGCSAALASGWICKSPPSQRTELVILKRSVMYSEYQWQLYLEAKYVVILAEPRRGQFLY